MRIGDREDRVKATSVFWLAILIHLVGASAFAFALGPTTLPVGSSTSAPASDYASAPGGDPQGTAAAYVEKLRDLPKITKPVMFNTSQADEILKHMQVFPTSSPLNEDISRRPAHPLSKEIIAATDAGRGLGCNLDMGFVIVPPDQKRIPLELIKSPAESDPGPYPIPDNAPIEGWPLVVSKEFTTLERYQRSTEGCDRHMLIVDPIHGLLYEFYAAHRSVTGWEAGCAAVFDMKTNAMRPERWSSTDAAGLPVFPLCVRYNDVESGEVKHAIRVTFEKTRRDFVYPATHQASESASVLYPRMGERLRLKRDFDGSGLPAHARAICRGMKKYGLIVADNGLDWMISVTPDARIQGLEELKRIKGTDFEVIIPTGPDEGPRAPAR